MSEDAEGLIRRIKSTEEYFEILGIGREASQRDVTVAYRKLALLLHPDKCDLPDGELAFKKVAAAFACLRDPEQRSQYEVSCTTMLSCLIH